MFIMLVKRKKRLIDFIVIEQYRRCPGIFAGNVINRVQYVYGSLRKIRQVANGCSYKI